MHVTEASRYVILRPGGGSVALSISAHRGRPLIVPKADERRMPQQSFGGPLDEPDFRDNRRLHPSQGLHVFSGDALAPMALAHAVWQVDEWASRDWMVGNATHDFGSHVGREAGTHPSREEQFPFVEIPHK